MKERLTNNLGLKLLSIFLAFFVWLMVVNVSNPVVYRTQEVTVEMVNGEILERAQQTYEVVGKSTVTVGYNVRTLDAYRISSADFRAYADLAELYEVTGSIPIKVEVVNSNTKRLIEEDGITTNPGVIRIKTEEIQRKGFTLQINSSGTPEEGYAVGTATVTSDYVYVKGPESLIRQINYVGIEIDIDNANSDLSGTAAPILYDANGKNLNFGDKVEINVKEIGYQVPILKVKNLNLDFDVAGEVASGYRFTGVEASMKGVSVVGLKSALANLSSLTIPAEKLNINGLTEDKVVEVDVSEFLPENVKIVDENHIVTITLKVEALTTRSVLLNVADIQMIGNEEGKEYTFSKDSIEVVVRGLEEDLDSLVITDLNTAIDLTNLEDGIHAGVLSFKVGEAFDVVSYETFEVTVVTEGQPEEGPGEGSDGETESSSGESEEETTQD